MRFMIMVKATADSEAGVMPSTELLTEMGAYNEQLVSAGIMLAGEGLHPSSQAVRIRFSGDQRTVVEGPFAETKDLLAGYWLWNVDSLDEAIEWVKRCPNPMLEESEIEIRQVLEADDFGEVFTPEAREQEERLRAEIAARVAAGATGDRQKRVMILHMWDPRTEDTLPDEAAFAEMVAFNEELVKAGLMIDGEGLHPSRRGARVVFSGPNRTVIHGPFTESKELVAGFWVWRVKSMDEAIEWVKRCPMPADVETELEIRPIFEAADFGEEYTPELRERDERLRSRAPGHL